jgi:hypothetical protein
MESLLRPPFPYGEANNGTDAHFYGIPINGSLFPNGDGSVLTRFQIEFVPFGD